MKGFTRLPRRSCHRSWNVPDAFCPAHIFLWSLSVSCLASSADLWQIISASQSLGVPGAADVFPGMILFTGQDPDPFGLRQLSVWGILGTMLCGGPALRLLLGKVMDGVTYSRPLRLLTQIPRRILVP